MTLLIKVFRADCIPCTVVLTYFSLGKRHVVYNLTLQDEDCTKSLTYSLLSVALQSYTFIHGAGGSYRRSVTILFSIICPLVRQDHWSPNEYWRLRIAAKEKSSSTCLKFICIFAKLTINLLHNIWIRNLPQVEFLQVAKFSNCFR